MGFYIAQVKSVNLGLDFASKFSFYLYNTVCKSVPKHRSLKIKSASMHALWANITYNSLCYKRQEFVAALTALRKCWRKQGWSHFKKSNLLHCCRCKKICNKTHLFTLNAMKNNLKFTWEATTKIHFQWLNSSVLQFSKFIQFCLTALAETQLLHL